MCLPSTRLLWDSRTTKAGQSRACRSTPTVRSVTASGFGIMHFFARIFSAICMDRAAMTESEAKVEMSGDYKHFGIEPTDTLAQIGCEFLTLLAPKFARASYSSMFCGHTFDDTK